MKHIISIISGLSLLAILNACQTKTGGEVSVIATDSATIATGESLFRQDCSTCHNFYADGIGPQLAGVTLSLGPEWIATFMKDPKSVIESGDSAATAHFNKFKTIMPSFAHYTDDKIGAILAFLQTHKTPGRPRAADDPNALKNPIPEPIPMSDLVVNLKLVTQIPPSSEENPRTRITKLCSQPNSDELFVLDLRGKLYHLEGGTKPVVYMDMNTLIPNFIHKPGLATGFGSFAFHPEFAKNGLLYTTHTEPAAAAKADYDYADSIKVTLQWVVSEWKTNQPRAFPFAGERRELFRVNMVSAIHGVQEITFNPLSKPGDADYGLLYIGIGDGGSAENGYPFLCHSTEKIWGTVLRIDPRANNSRNGHYGIPAINPFAKTDNPKVNQEIFAYGFRNPHRISWSKDGRMMVANIGHQMVESLYIVKPGDDCGWPIREGTFVIDPSQNMYNIYPRTGGDGGFHITYPVAEYDHDEGNAIAGGFEYSGKALPALKGKYLFGDIVKGRLFYVEMKDLKLGSQAPIKEWRINLDGELKTLSQLCGADKVDERFGVDRFGELYITTKPDGRVYKLIGTN